MLADAHTSVSVVTWLSQNWLWVIIWAWILGFCEETLRRFGLRRRRRAELKHQRAVELALARRGLVRHQPAAPARARPPVPVIPDDADDWDEDDDWDDEDDLDEEDEPHRVYRPRGDSEFALPAAVIPAPPAAQPVRQVPGPCRHEKIVPVFTDLEGHSDMTLVRWVCASPRCDAEFPAGIAVYEEPGGRA